MRQPTDVVIIGAGPYGLSLAAHLQARGIDFRIFGRPMDTWAEHMPKNMTLKSEGFASNLCAPTSDFTLSAWSRRTGVPHADRDLPITLDNFLAYAHAFRERFVPDLENRQVTSLSRTATGFNLTLDDGEEVAAKQVVLAVGVSCFAYMPSMLAALPFDLISHSYDYREVSQFKSKKMGVLGTGSSAIDLAHQLRLEGASPLIIGRAQQIQYNIVPDPARHTLFYRLQNPPSPIGRGWRSYFCAMAPLAFYHMPQHLKDRAIASHTHAAGGWFMREQVESIIPTLLGRTLIKAEAQHGRVELTLETRDGSHEVEIFDHVVAATGYRVDLKRIPFLSEALKAQIELVGSSPWVSDNFETSVPGLYSIGLSAMQMFGPLLRFMVGAEFVAPRLSAHLDRTAERMTTREAA
jgi:cation diffusion facilitator CzcD-associated flavoprotein CzcO